MKIYLDACCVNRLTDDQSQPRIRAEAEAIEDVLKKVRRGDCDWLGSEVLTLEIEQSPMAERKSDNRALLALSGTAIPATDKVLARARLLTTDDKFIRRAARGDGTPRVRVCNPVTWLEELS